MAGFKCRCGLKLSNHLAPNDIQLRIYTDKEWDDMINIGMMDSVDIPFPKYDVWRCPRCERIYVFDAGKAIKVYTLEKGDSQNSGHLSQ